MIKKRKFEPSLCLWLSSQSPMIINAWLTWQRNWLLTSMWMCWQHRILVCKIALESPQKLQKHRKVLRTRNCNHRDQESLSWIMFILTVISVTIEMLQLSSVPLGWEWTRHGHFADLANVPCWIGSVTVMFGWNLGVIGEFAKAYCSILEGSSRLFLCLEVI